uniref:C2H2-type domain-containing protein n=1 Tax=Heterorhabditis bacteriophora TaxID=37862 RepID=A0A1I7XAX6_HETBA
MTSIENQPEDINNAVDVGTPTPDLSRNRGSIDKQNEIENNSGVLESRNSSKAFLTAAWLLSAFSHRKLSRCPKKWLSLGERSESLVRHAVGHCHEEGFVLFD